MGIVLMFLAILNGFIVGGRWITPKYRRPNLLTIIMGIIYALATMTVYVSFLPFILGAVIVFAPILLWILRVVLFGNRAYQRGGDNK